MFRAISELPFSRIRGPLLSTILLALLANGCAQFHNEPLSAESDAGQLDNRSLNDPGLRSFLEHNLGTGD